MKCHNIRSGLKAAIPFFHDIIIFASSTPPQRKNEFSKNVRMLRKNLLIVLGVHYNTL